MGQAKVQRRLAAQQFDAMATQRRLTRQREDGRTGALAEMASRPDIVAHHEAQLADEELQARWQADAPGQHARLTEAGWVRAFPGDCGLGGYAHRLLRLQLLHDIAREPDGSLWSHASATYTGLDRLPAWEVMRDIHWLLYPDRAGVQVMAPRSQHVNIGEVAHIWTRLDAPSVPDFGRFGTI
jgi:hypothetical protein